MNISPARWAIVIHLAYVIGAAAGCAEAHEAQDAGALIRMCLVPGAWSDAGTGEEVLPLRDDPSLLPGVARTTRMSELTEEQHAEFCHWFVALADGGQWLECPGDRRTGQFSLSACLSGRAYYPPGCPDTLGDTVDCQLTRVACCLAGEPLGALRPASCRRSMSCPEMVLGP